MLLQTSSHSLSTKSTSFKPDFKRVGQSFFMIIFFFNFFSLIYKTKYLYTFQANQLQHVLAQKANAYDGALIGIF